MAAASVLSACASVAERPARSSAGCARSVVEQRLPPDLPDKLAHCLAGGLIARYCSPTEARLAGIAKEMRDLLGDGDPEWADWTATRAGVACAGDAAEPAAIKACCASSYPP